MTDLKTLFHELIRFETELWNAIDTRLRSGHDLPLTWFEPMQVMARYPVCRVYDIAGELSITPGGTSKLVDRIEAAGLCCRKANPADRRSHLIELTPAGNGSWPGRPGPSRMSSGPASGPWSPGAHWTSSPRRWPSCGLRTARSDRPGRCRLRLLAAGTA